MAQWALCIDTRRLIVLWWWRVFHVSLHLKVSRSIFVDSFKIKSKKVAKVLTFQASSSIFLLNFETFDFWLSTQISGEVWDWIEKNCVGCQKWLSSCFKLTMFYHLFSKLSGICVKHVCLFLKCRWTLEIQDSRQVYQIWLIDYIINCFSLCSAVWRCLMRLKPNIETCLKHQNKCKADNCQIKSLSTCWTFWNVFKRLKISSDLLMSIHSKPNSLFQIPLCSMFCHSFATFQGFWHAVEYCASHFFLDPFLWS